MLLAKESLLDPIDMHVRRARRPKTRLEELRIEICDKVNALGIDVLPPQRGVLS